jgi:hypothetical protein
MINLPATYVVTFGRLYYKYVDYIYYPGATKSAPGKYYISSSSSNEENSPTFDRRVSPLVGAATQESNVWFLSVKGRKKEK